jgi:fructose-bisphosphate aldolase class II
VDVPVALLLDYGRDVVQVIAYLCAGSGSVMFDGQGLPFDHTPAMTETLAGVTHASGAAPEVSAESFGLPGADNNLLDTTDPEQARALRGAGADLAACAVGSEHGHASRLALPLVRTIHAQAGGPLALYGGSGIQVDDLRAAVACGVCKVNFGSDLYRGVDGGVGPRHTPRRVRVHLRGRARRRRALPRPPHSRAPRIRP